MSEPKSPQSRDRLDISTSPPRLRDRVIAGLLLLLAGWCVVSAAYGVIRGFWDTGFVASISGILADWRFYVLIGGTAVFMVLHFWRQGNFTWMRLARRPAEEMSRGASETAERAYQKALARAMQFPPQDIRRGKMLYALSSYLFYQGRFREMRALAEECVEIFGKHQRQAPLAYFLAVKTFAVLLVDCKEYESAQRILEKAIDEILLLKKPVTGTAPAASNAWDVAALAEWDFVLHWTLVYLLVEAGELDEAKLQMDEVDLVLKRLHPRWQASYRDTLLILQSLWYCAAERFAEASSLCQQIVTNLEDPVRVRVQTQVDLARQEYGQAEQRLRQFFDVQRKNGTLHRPDLLPQTLGLAESLFGQGKHDEAFTSFQEARSIVADFAMPADRAWRKTLATWLPRAKDSGRAELASSLEKELASPTPNQAITVLERFRLRRQAPG
jgi:tetratricopeptide (TPR) repeat protein